MPRNPSRRARQMVIIAPPLEICLLPPSPPDVTPFSRSSFPRSSFCLTRCPDAGIITMVGGGGMDQVAGAISIGALRWPPSNT